MRKKPCEDAAGGETILIERNDSMEPHDNTIPAVLRDALTGYF